MVVARLLLMTLVIMGAQALTHAYAQTGEGLTKPIPLPVFDAAQPVCSPPPGLERALVFAQDNDRQFMQGAAFGLAAAARDRGLAFRIEMAANDPARMIEQVKAAMGSKAGAIVAAPINAVTLAPTLMDASPKRGESVVGDVPYRLG